MKRALALPTAIQALIMLFVVLVVGLIINSFRESGAAGLDSIGGAKPSDIEEADRLRAAGDCGSAVALYERFIGNKKNLVYPHIDEVVWNAADCYEQLGNRNKANEHYQRLSAYVWSVHYDAAKEKVR